MTQCLICDACFEMVIPGIGRTLCGRCRRKLILADLDAEQMHHAYHHNLEVRGLKTDFHQCKAYIDKRQQCTLLEHLQQSSTEHQPEPEY